MRRREGMKEVGGADGTENLSFSGRVYQLVLTVIIVITKCGNNIFSEIQDMPPGIVD